MEVFMSKFNEDVKLLLTYVGGKENIKAVSHCVTRMRFVLADPNKADIAKIEALPCTKGALRSEPLHSQASFKSLSEMK